MLVCGDSLRGSSRHLDEPPEEPPGGIPVRVLAEYGFQKHPIAVDGPTQITPPPEIFTYVSSMYLDSLRWPRRLNRSWSESNGAKRTSQLGMVSVGDFVAAYAHQLRDVPEAEPVPQPPEHGQENDVRGH